MLKEHFATLPLILKHIQMQSRSHSSANPKTDDCDDGYIHHPHINPFLRRHQDSSSRVLHQASTATTTRGDDSDFVTHNSAAHLPIVDRLDAAGQFAVSFESTQSQKPPGYSRDCLNVNPVPRAISEPPASFLAAVRQVWVAQETHPYNACLRKNRTSSVLHAHSIFCLSYLHKKMYISYNQCSLSLCLPPFCSNLGLLNLFAQPSAVKAFIFLSGWLMSLPSSVSHESIWGIMLAPGLTLVTAKILSHKYARHVFPHPCCYINNKSRFASRPLLFGASQLE